MAANKNLEHKTRRFSGDCASYNLPCRVGFHIYILTQLKCTVNYENIDTELNYKKEKILQRILMCLHMSYFHYFEKNVFHKESQQNLNSCESEHKHQIPRTTLTQLYPNSNSLLRVFRWCLV